MSESFSLGSWVSVMSFGILGLDAFAYKCKLRWPCVGVFALEPYLQGLNLGSLASDP